MDVPHIDEQLARRLIDGQFPRWADLPIASVEFGGVDNRTFRLGSELIVRLPSGEWYALQVEKEQRWLPRREPGEDYPFSWSVYRWLEGENASERTIGDLTEFATTLASFLRALQGADASGGPEPGRHNFYRGGPLGTYADETVRAIETLGGEIPAEAMRVWEDAMAATWDGSPVWFHGDVAAGNLLVREGRLAAVIDFGTSGVGDPACDVVIAWTLLHGESRDAFRSTLGADPDTWSRGRGWALWKALITLAGQLESDAEDASASRRVIERVLADYARDVSRGA